MNLDSVIAWLRQRIGLDPESLGPTALARAVAHRMKTLGLTTPTDYVARLENDAEEFQQLLGEVTVPETWFFRGGDLFAYLAQQIVETIHQRRGERRFRILTVPCSTGEEPYSLALALAEHSVPPTGWQIEAVDLSERQLARARHGCYREISFRQTPSEIRQRYFRAAAGGWELDPTIRAQVQFQQGNLLDPQFLSGEPPFDLIFCRNLLIYLHPAARREALNRIEQLLAPEGWLCTGHAEPLEFVDPRFRRIGPPGTFLYRRTSGSVDSRQLLTSTLPPPTVAAALPTPASASTPPAARLDSPLPPVDLLARARQQADSGELSEALQTCQTHLSQSSPSADAFSLLGVIHQARREREEAIRCYQRALYLEPGHRDALTHLMLLCQEQGEHAQADRLRRRLARPASGGDS